jgi:amino acid permease
MDWTAVFDETGDEDLVIPHLFKEHPTMPRLSRLVNKMYHGKSPSLLVDDADTITHMVDHRLMEMTEGDRSESKYSLQALYFLSINYILGVGCLGIPYAFARAGFVLCSLILLTVSILSYVTVMWVAETGVRFELALTQDSEEATEETRLLKAKNDRSYDANRYEVLDLISYYLGPWHKLLYQSSLMALMYVGLLAYSQVFCGAITALVNTDFISGVPQLIFGFMVVPLSCMELDEQITAQSIMAYLRFLAIGIMIGGSLLALLIDDSRASGQGHAHPPYFAPSEPEKCQMSYTTCFSGFGVAFSTALFSQLFQHSIPGLLRPLREQPNLIVQAPRVFGASLITTCSLYLLLGTSAASYFGADTHSSVNLNFANFIFGLDPLTTPVPLLLFLRLASKLVVMFPALDTISVFPLIANTLGNNFYAGSGPSFLKWVARKLVLVEHLFVSARRTNRRRCYSDLCSDDRREMIERASRLLSIFWRLMAALPPLVFSVWAKDLSFSLLLAGVAGLYVAFVAPSLLQMASKTCVKQTNTFTGWYSASHLAYPVLAFTSFALVMVLLQILDAVKAL